MNSFLVVFSIKAKTELEKLPGEVQERITIKLKEAKNNPFHFFERLRSRVDYKLRVGDYRIIADIDNNLKRIEITKIGHRRDIYKR